MASTSYKTISPSPSVNPSKDRSNDNPGNTAAVTSPNLATPLSVPTVSNALDDENEQGSSGDEWGMEIGNLIIDLDADLEKDEMKEKGGNVKNDSRNSNNNNSIKGSARTKSPTNSQTSKVGPPTSTGSKSETAAVAKNTKAGNASNQNSGKSKSKSKKSGKSGSSTKHNGGGTTAATGQNSRTQSEPGKDYTGNAVADAANKGNVDAASNQPNTSSGLGYSAPSRAKNPENSHQDNMGSNKSGGKSSKSGRSSKKHGKNAGNEKKGEHNIPPLMTVTTGKEAREKSKIGKNGKYIQSGSVSVTHVGSTYMSSPNTAVSSAGLAMANNMRSNSPIVANMPTFSNHCNAVSAVACEFDSATTAARDGSQEGSALVSQPLDVSEQPAAAHRGKHRKTSSMPAPMRFATPCTMASADILPNATGRNNIDTTIKNASSLSSTMDLACQSPAVSGGKRDRNAVNVVLSSASSKKIKLEKDWKSFTAVAGEAATSSSANTQLHGDMLTAVLNTAGHYSGSRDILNGGAGGNRMLVSSSGHTKSFSSVNVPHAFAGGHASNLDSFTKARSKTTLSEASSPSVAHPGNSHQTPGDVTVTSGFTKTNMRQIDANVADGDSLTPATTRTVGTITTYADIGVTTEPESLGPCEPGTSVHLDGIVWHETESGVLVVNVTWRNKSYVGTLLDATKHDWAPPRIPDADSDVELRAKSGRPKRQRGGNGGNGCGDAGRKGRKSAVLNNNMDDYKNSPSSSKRRSAKMSESDACSGNDGEICTTPSKSAKRARMSSARGIPSSSKQKSLVLASNVAKESTSGEGTSGSGSSSCSSPVFVECPYANCKKKYNNSNALKYHKAHAHCGEDTFGAEEGEKSGQDADSPVADSPKDSDNMSTKSTEALGSDSVDSPNNIENESVAENTNNYPTTAETESVAAQVPFVVTQPPPEPSPQPNLVAQYIPTQFSVSSQAMSAAGGFEGGYRGAKVENTDYPGAVRNESPDVKSANQEEPRKREETVSPYALTDMQTNDSISLKVPTQITKQTSAYDVTNPSVSYGESLNATCEPYTPMETTSAVDSESAQAVKTLLQLQDSQDLLPGLTQYNQASQPQVMTISSQSSRPPPTTIIPSSAQAYPPHSASALAPGPERIAPRPQPAEQVVQLTPIETHQTQQPAIPSYKTPGVTGQSDHVAAPLPRMSVGISSDPAGSAINNQYVVSRGSFSSHAHGTVTTNPSQEGGALYTSSGVKMAKGKTVPIPTDPLQTPSSATQSGIPSVVSTGSAGKKQKKKKPKIEPGKAVRHSPTDGVSPGKSMNFASAKPSPREGAQLPRYALQEPSSVRVKQELVVGNLSQHPMQSSPGGPGNMAAHKPHHGYSQTYGSGKPLQGQPGASRTSVKTEAGLSLPVPGAPQMSRSSKFVQPSVPTPQRQYQMHPKIHCEQVGQTQEPFHPGAPHAMPSNRNNNNKQMPPAQISERGIPSISQHAPGSQCGASPAVMDAAEQSTGESSELCAMQRRGPTEPRSKSHLALPSGSSHSLPGSRSLTPVSQALASQGGGRSGIASGRDSSTPKTISLPGSSQTGRSQSQDADSQGQHSGRRGSADEKYNPVAAQRAYAAPAMQHVYPPLPFPYIPGYDLGTYQAKYMHDPQFQQHYENVIQQEMQKDLPKEQQQRVREEQGLLLATRAHLSPSPSAQSKMARLKMQSPRPVEGDRSSREDSTHRGQHQIQTMQARSSHPQVQHPDRDIRGGYNHRGPQGQPPPGRADVRSQHGASPASSHGSYPSTPSRLQLATPSGARGLSPNPHATPPLAGSRPPRPSSETERLHRRDTGLADRASAVIRTSNPTPTRKTAPDQRPQSPEKPKSGPHPSAPLYASPALQALPGAHTPLQYYPNPYPAQIFADPRGLPQYGFPGVPPGYAVYQHSVFPGQWPMHERIPPAPTPEKPAPAPHVVKPVHERSSSGSRSPYREETGRRSRGEAKARDPGSYSSAKERRTSDGPPPVRQSVTPDPKSIPVRNADGSTGSASPPTQRHHHTHHHIHEGFPIISPQYPFPGSIPMASVMAGSEAAAALAQFPNREIP